MARQVFGETQASSAGLLLASAARTATAATPIQTNANARGVTVKVNVSAVSGTTPTLGAIFQEQEFVSGNWHQINATPTNITATGIYVYHLYPGVIVPGAGTTISQVTPIALGATWRVNFVIGGTTPSFTFSASYVYHS